MIKEWFESVFTRTAPIYRKLGYVYASVALQGRFSRCKISWQSHIDNCHAAILQSVQNFENSPDRCALIVGSGPLHEIPVAGLLLHFKKIVLLDVVHPRAVQRLAKREPKIELLTYDVTGFATAVADEKKVRELEFSPPKINFDYKFDLVISANILSQLPLEPFAAAKKRWSWANDSYFKKLSKKMSVDHAEWLKKLSAPVTLLIADTERVYFDAAGVETERAASAGVLPLGRLEREWEWHIAPLGEVSRQFRYSMRVECRRL